jgi:hypothetical protein
MGWGSGTGALPRHRPWPSSSRPSYLSGKISPSVGPNFLLFTFVDRNVESAVLEGRELTHVHHEPWIKSVTMTTVHVTKTWKRDVHCISGRLWFLADMFLIATVEYCVVRKQGAHQPMRHS